MSAASALRRSLLDKDFLGGVLTIALGAGAVLAGRQFQLGTLGRMGPGFFPVAIGAAMVLTGLVILVGGIRSARKQADRIAVPDWRAWTLVPLSLVAFIVIGGRAGLLPATVSVVTASALADRNNTWRDAIALAAVMSLVCVVVFWWALQVPFPLLSWESDE